MRTQTLLPVLFPLAASATPHLVRRQEGTVVLPTESFTDFATYWNYNYPWGTDHNGGARMNEAQVSVDADGVLTLTADPAEGEPPAENGGVEYPVNYLSGAVHAKQTFTVAAGGGYDFSGEFLATTTQGTWPAFWLNAASGWPPEIDMAEWKGSGDISFNTFNTSSEVATHDVPYGDASQWHSVRAELRDADGSTLQVKYFLDDVEQTTQYGANYIGAGMRL